MITKTHIYKADHQRHWGYSRGPHLYKDSTENTAAGTFN